MSITILRIAAMSILFTRMKLRQCNTIIMQK
jgi:hypothetical protein